MTLFSFIACSEKNLYALDGVLSALEGVFLLRDALSIQRIDFEHFTQLLKTFLVLTFYPDPTNC